MTHRLEDHVTARGSDSDTELPLTQLTGSGLTVSSSVTDGRVRMRSTHHHNWQSFRPDRQNCATLTDATRPVQERGCSAKERGCSAVLKRVDAVLKRVDAVQC